MIPPTAPAQAVRGHRKTAIGTVVSNRMMKTIVVRVTRLVRHPMYHRVLVRASTFKVHDDTNRAGIGDWVKIMETRPLSKEKRWRLVEILRRASSAPPIPGGETEERPAKEARAPQEPIDRGRGNPPAPVFGPGQLHGEPGGAPRRPGQGQGENRAFGLQAEARGTPAPGPVAAGMQARGPIGRVAATPAVEQRAGDPCLPAVAGDIAHGVRAGHYMEAIGVYTVVEGHGRSSPSPHTGDLSNGKDSSYDPPLLSTLKRNSSA